MKLNDLRDNPGATKKRTRVGRGPGSGKGKTGGRGIKGQGSRSGVALAGYEGGQMPLYRRLPKRGFTKPNQKHFAVVNLGLIQKFVDAKKLDAKKVIDHEALKAAGVARGGKDGVRLLGKGEITAKLTFKVAGASKGAVAAVEKAGGGVELIDNGPPEHEKKAARREANKAAKAG
jgi:large subunit ribosomal protein L15